MTEMFGEAWSPMSVPDLAPDDDDDDAHSASRVMILLYPYKENGASFFFILFISDRAFPVFPIISWLAFFAFQDISYKTHLNCYYFLLHLFFIIIMYVLMGSM